MSYSNNNNNNLHFRGFLDENLKNPRDAEFAREWNKMIREEKNNYNINSSYGSSLSVTTCNWGNYSNVSSVFSASYYMSR
jgi:hypothetical protein